MGHAFIKGNNRSTSVASLVSRTVVRKIERSQGRRIAKVIGKKAARKLFMRAGGIIGRGVPLVGWGLTIYDIWANKEVIGTGLNFSAGGGDYYKLTSDPENGWKYIK